VSLNLNEQSLGNDDYLQIETDYICTITGFKKKEDEKVKYSTGELLQAGLLTFNNGRVFFQENNKTLELYAQAMVDLSTDIVILANSGITSLNGLVNSEAREIVTQLTINNCDYLPNSEFLKLVNLVNLTTLICRNTSRDKVDWRTIIQALNLTVIDLLLCWLTQETADLICRELDNKGNINGHLNLSNNNGVTTASQTARNNLIAKGWTILTN
ncbi:MAG: hypothetical protein F6K35_04535, partial [Okeania sp. SIO2H7]|nr:hypothetical protein [Okeania sp. SIO2H7]